MKPISILLLTFLSFSLFSQSFTGEQALQGYGVFGEKLTFIFDETLYNVQPEKVVVTGEFRSWDNSMSTDTWGLNKTGQQWLLTIDNADFTVVEPNTKFKFRINDGEWLQPPSDAPNEKGGDLVFM